MALQGQYRQHFVQHVTQRVMAHLLPPLGSWLPLTNLRKTSKLSSLGQAFWQPQNFMQSVGDAGFARRMYSGIFDFSGETVKVTPDRLFEKGLGGPAWTRTLMSLTWLSHFMAQPKRLNACYVVNVMQAWNLQLLRPDDVDTEVSRLSAMTVCFPAISHLLEKTQCDILLTAYSIQQDRLLRARPRSTGQATAKAIALLKAALATLNPRDNLVDNLKLLEISLQQLVHRDGGPVAGGISVHFDLANQLSNLATLLQHRNCSWSTTTQQALDSITGFLAMFQRSDNSLAFGLAAHPNTISLTASAVVQKLAINSGVAHLKHNRCVVIACNGTPNNFVEDATGVDISFGKHALVSFDSLAPVATASRLQLHEDAMGSLLGLNNRQIFIAASGYDIRIEETLPEEFEPTNLRLRFATETKLSLARHGNSASLALPDRSLWQITVRGGCLTKGSHDQELLISTDQKAGTRLNWAIKRVADQRPQRQSKTKDLGSNLLI